LHLLFCTSQEKDLHPIIARSVAGLALCCGTGFNNKTPANHTRKSKAPMRVIVVVVLVVFAWHGSTITERIVTDHAIEETLFLWKARLGDRDSM
jgi:hypothetical protein